ncbi:MAG: translocation/assembly module TamB domain-containing protein [Chlorogloeopsis fritschii C42_A2020_084]|uniref:translocation/assembly module TamB domain-containing protein n=1 Tax=Chlorogloeopsis fritschii TaxID=1124 RepID=UPI001A010040|nr:translocation/assembly module TamB domain-containing protein [Chlorogloeopsis fritschii]MBF2009560.1 translocation/assembly module TamB domain-containing protein [Chlorogloeopsis fritschii C42_A2020_084]
MSKSPNPKHHSKTLTNKRLWLLLLSRSSITLGGFLLLGLVGGAWRLQSFIHKDLTPLAEKSLTNTLNRPVKIGEVKEFSLSGVKFGASAIPATPTDPDYVEVEAVEVRFDPLWLLFAQNLKLDVTLVNPNVYIEQDEEGRWTTTTLAKPGKGGPIQTELDKLRFRDAQLTLVPNEEWRKEQEKIFKVAGVGESKPETSSPAIQSVFPPGFFSAVAFSQLNGTAQLLEKNELIKFDVAGKANTGGNLSLQGDIRPKTLATNLKIRGQDLLASDITRLIKLPLALQAGKVNGDLQMQAQLGQTQPPLLSGSVGLQNVQAQVPRVPQPFINSLGTLRFQDTEVKLDNLVTSYGKIPLVANGIIDTKAGYKLTGRVNTVSVEAAQETLKLKLPVPVTGEVKADLQLVGEPTDPILSGTVATIKPARIDKVDFNSARGKFEYSPTAAVITFKDIQGQTKVGGEIGGTGKVELGTTPQLDFNLTAKNVPGDAIAYLYNSKTPFQIGTVSATAKLTGAADNAQTVVQFRANQAQYPTTGEVVVKGDRSLSFRNVAVSVGGGKLVAAGNWNQQRWQAVADASQIQLKRFINPSQLQNVSLNNANLNGRLILSGTSAPFKIASIDTQNAKVQVADGTVAVSKIQLGEKSFSAQLIANGVRLGRLLKSSPPALQGALAGNFQISGNTDDFNLKTLQGSGSARLAMGGGTVTASNIQLADGIYQAQVQANNLQLQQLAQLPQQFQGRLKGQLNIAGSLESFQPQAIEAKGQAQLNVAGGTITATNIQLANGRYQAVVDANGVKLNQFSEQLQGNLGGKIQIAGNLETQNFASLQNLRALGQLQFSQGIAGIEQPLTAEIGWDGEKLLIERATARDLNANGYILTKATSGIIPEIAELALNVKAKNYNLNKLPIKLPNAVDVAGKADFSGQITGKLPTPNLLGTLALRDLAVNKFAFEPVLTGNIQSVQGQGLNLNVSGTRDKLAFNLDANNRPTAFAVKWQEATATGTVQGDNLVAKVENFPLTVLNVGVPATTFLGAGKVAGLLSGNLQINQKTWATSGDIAIAKPQLARISGDRLSAQFRYQDGKVTLHDSAFIRGNSRYAMVGTFAPTAAGPQIKGKLTVNQGQIQDILTTLQLFDIKDFQRGVTTAPSYGSASDLRTVSVGLANQPLLTQIQRFSEIEALLAQQQQQRRDASFMPDLTDLKGTFNGEVAVDTATAKKMAVKFNFNGQNFVWGREDEPERLYTAERVIAQGSFENGVLTLLPLRLESNNRLIAFTGNIGGTEQSGQLRVTNLPLQLLNNYVNLPVGLTGNINATATLAGSTANPLARGELYITEGTLNQKGVESANASFSYNNGRLNFGSNVMVSGSEPVTITGSLPYKLPFASVMPDSNQVSLDVKVQNEGLAVLNLLTDQVAFEKGEGDVNLTVSGTTEQPVLKGIATVKGATFAAQALPEKLTDVTGKVEFNFDRIKVESLQGKFSKGNVIAQGEIPVFSNSQQSIDNPLNVSLNQLAVNLKGRYEGGVSGDLLITGSALNPAIGGNLKLSDGQVLLTESANAVANANDEQNALLKAIKQEKSNAGSTATRLDDLQIVLGKNVEIALPPILSFRATGSLSVNGSLNKPEPEGTIRLRNGDVNLFTTQFNLARGYEHTATFRGNQNPDLDIRLIASVLDANPLQVTSSSVSSEINDGIITTFDPVNTVRVEARIDGPASQLNQHLELTSNPSRSETEIVALLGGSFVETLGRGDTTLGLVNLAGSALNLQRTFNQIGNAFGLSELRLFPTITFDDTNTTKKNTSSVDLAMEAGVDVSRSFSVSALKILTSDKPPQFGINYRLNPELRLRTSTDLSGDNRAVLEYEDRF